MKKLDPQFKIRLSEDLKRRLEVAARESARSMNAEIVHRLAMSFAEKPPAESAGEAFNQVIRAQTELRRLLAEFQQYSPKELIKAFSENKEATSLSLGRKKTAK